MTYLRLNLAETESGCPLYSKVWSWTNAATPVHVSTLVQIFCQFATGLDDGDISRVSFGNSSAPPPVAPRRAGGSRRAPSLSVSKSAGNGEWNGGNSENSGQNRPD